MKRKWFPWLVACMSAIASGLAINAQAQTYPSKAIKIIVPFAPGTATDTLARLAGQHLSEALKQPVIVENKAGANGILGADAVAKATPDGYTLLFTTNTTQAANPGLMKTLPYKPATDFAPVSLIGNGSFVLASRPDAPFSNLTQLVTYAKANSGKVSYATANSSGIISGAMLGSGAGLEWVHVPYKNGPGAISDVLGGQVTTIFVDLQSGLPYLKSGKLKGIALTSAKANPTLPDLPTLSSAPGMKSFDLSYWMAVYAPAGTPVGIINLLNHEIVKFTKRRDVVDRFFVLGFSVDGSSPSELGQFTVSEILKWKSMIDAAGIVPE